MKRVAAIIGRPGTGKSTLVRAFMERAARDWRIVMPGSLLKAPLLKAHYSPSLRTSVLGDYTRDEMYPGTDRLSMAVAPQALEWIKECGDHSIVFEGDRLGNASTLRLLSLDSRIDLRVWCLIVPEDELQRRYELRGSEQNEQVLKARATKVANICANPNLRVKLHRNHTFTRQAAILDELLRFAADDGE